MSQTTLPYCKSTENEKHSTRIQIVNEIYSINNCQDTYPVRKFHENWSINFLSNLVDKSTNRQKQTRKALTRGRTDHLVTSLQFPINVCFQPLFSVSHPKKRQFSPVTLNFDLWPWTDRVRRREPSWQISTSKMNLFEHTQTHLQQTNYTTWPTKWSVKIQPYWRR